MERTQETSDRTYVFGKTEYKAKKAVWIPGEVGDGSVDKDGGGGRRCSVGNQ